MSQPVKDVNTRRNGRETGAEMRAAFRCALERAVAARQSGTVVLPTGVAAVGEVGRVLRALKRAE